MDTMVKRAASDLKSQTNANSDHSKVSVLILAGCRDGSRAATAGEGGEGRGR